jgi:hypothetical protein
MKMKVRRTLRIISISKLSFIFGHVGIDMALLIFGLQPRPFMHGHRLILFSHLKACITILGKSNAQQIRA